MDITIVADRSGSMGSIRADVVGGINAFIAGQQALAGDADLTLVLFDHEYEVVMERRPVRHVEPLNESSYVPRGMTALHDAVCRAIADANKRLEGTEAGAMLVIVTDGLDNKSRTCNKA